MSAIITRKGVKRPIGRKPSHIEDWLAANGHDEWWALVCPKCGKWVAGIDKLAPYHTEMNWCKRCDKT